MAVHFPDDEFAARKAAVLSEMENSDLDALLLFAPESHYWLTGYDTFGFCFFQCIVLRTDGELTLLTRSADLRQAQRTSIIEDIRIWTDAADARPACALRGLLADLGLKGHSLGIEYDTHGLTAGNGRAVDNALAGFARTMDASAVIPRLRTIKSVAEIAFVRQAGELADNALDTALDLVGPGADEAEILAAMQSAVLAGGGDYPGNPFIIGSAEDALLCRTKSGRRRLSANDQITLEFAGVYRMYHVALMRTIVIGEPKPRHLELFEAAAEALQMCEEAMRPGRTFGDVYAAHARVFAEHGLSRHQLNACGYSLGTRYAPSWMDMPMFYAGNPEPILPNMVLFAHMILMDSETTTAMCLGRTCLTTEDAAEPLSRHDTGFLNR